MTRVTRLNPVVTQSDIAPFNESLPLTGAAPITAATTPAVGVITTYDATAGALTVTLPALSGLTVGNDLMVAKSALDVSPNIVMFNRAGSDTFDDGSTAVVLATPGETRHLQVVSIASVKYWKVLHTSVNTSAAAGVAGPSFDTRAVLGNIGFPPNLDLYVDESLEIGAGYSLEIPATSSLEIYTYVVETSKLVVGGAQNATVATSETTTSTSYTDLATTTDFVTVAIGPSGMAWVSVFGLINNNTAGNYSDIAFEASGANTLAANAAMALAHNSAANNAGVSASASFLLTGLNSGATTFKLKYKVTGGTGSYQNRRIAVMPL